ncbi:MAG TPA: endolytic transglycosylase MltG [Bryobacteraceae bacterium]|nr:endolytic transglycosylase MltG [Bryobacteraceae bacterium]
MRFLRRFASRIMVAAAAVGFVAYQLLAPYGSLAKPVFIDFPKGTTTRQIAVSLAGAGVIRHSWTFLIARILRPGATLQAGEYRFQGSDSAWDIYGRIARGDIFYYELKVPEGRNMFDIAAAVERLGLFPAADFLAAARNPSLIRDLDPEAPSLEGYLFPDTYRLGSRTTPESLCRLMTDRFRTVWSSLHTDAPVHRTVTLASLVEKEGKLADERPIIAAVFTRRLSIGMKLDCDPTTIYAALLEGGFDGAIHKSDLASDNAYNTYQHAGLPPGPIANPGLASIQAALHPANADYLYFVARADGSGGHNFSNTLAAHNGNVASYRRAAARQTRPPAASR